MDIEQMISSLNETADSPATSSRRRPLRLIAAPFTPMDGAGRLRLDVVSRQAALLTRQGVSGAFICGTTGEGLSLTLDERKRLCEAWCDVARGSLEILAHVGHCCVEESRELAKHAADSGAHAISVIAPPFFHMESPKTLAKVCRSIAEAAPDLPFYYYHMPSMSKVSFAASEALPLLRDAVPTFAGIKFTHEDLEDYQRCLQMAGPRYTVFFGRDEMLLDALRVGAGSAVGSTYNFAAPLYQDMAELYLSGDEEGASRVQNVCRQGIQVMVECGGLPAVKATMALFGLDCGPPRLPLSGLSDDQKTVLKGGLEKLGYFDRVASSQLRLR